jgi:acyl-CoA synthetase (AMP-forming)/AMP-acid ligase II
MTLLGRILDFFLRDPSRVFARVWNLREEAETVRYGDLVLRAAAAAEKMRSAGVGPGEIVVIVLCPGSELLSAWVSPLLLGAIPSIFPWPTEKLDREYYEKSVASLLKICGASALLTTRELASTLAPLAQDAPSLKSVLFLEGGEALPSLREVPRALLEDREAITLLQHSSGSTGLQKGVALSSRAVFNQIESYGQVLKVRDSDRVANWMPLYHDGGLIAGFLQPLLRGLPLSILSPIDWVHDPALLLRVITRDRATLCWLPNFSYNFMATKIPERRLEGVDLSSMRAFINTAEPVRPSSHELFRKKFEPYGLSPLSLTTSYGTAENTLAITQSDPERPVRVDRVDREALAREKVARPADLGSRSLAVLSSGAPIPDTRLVVFAEDYSRLPERRVGELAIQSNCMLTEYFRRPDLTAQAFHDGWYLTGDYGYVADGEVFVSGRKKDLIIVGGNNIYPQDLEFIADGVAGVHPGRTVAFGLENEPAGTEDVVVIAELEPGWEPRRVEDALRLAVARHSDCTVGFVHLVPPMWLIKTSSGKISRTRCKEKFLRERGPTEP